MEHAAQQNMPCALFVPHGLGEGIKCSPGAPSSIALQRNRMTKDATEVSQIPEIPDTPKKDYHSLVLSHLSLPL